MSKSKHTEVQMVAALKQMDAGRRAEDVAHEVGVSKIPATLPPYPDFRDRSPERSQFVKWCIVAATASEGARPAIAICARTAFKGDAARPPSCFGISKPGPPSWRYAAIDGLPPHSISISENPESTASSPGSSSSSTVRALIEKVHRDSSQFAIMRSFWSTWDCGCFFIHVTTSH